MPIVRVDYYGNKFDENGNYVSTDYSSSKAFQDQKAISDAYQYSAALYRQAEDTNDSAARSVALKQAAEAYNTVLRLRGANPVQLPVGTSPEAVVHTSLFTIGLPGGIPGGGGTFIPGTLPPPLPGGLPGDVLAPRQISTTLSTILQTINSIGSIVQATQDSIGDSIAAKVGDVRTRLEEIGTYIGGVVNDILGVVKGFGNNLLGGIGDVIRSIGDFVKNNLNSVIGEIIKFFKDHFTELIKDLAGLISKIADLVERVTQQVQKINDELIQPIATIVTTTLQTITTLTKAIEGDLHSGLAGILQIPGDIASGLASLDATMQRTVEQLGQLNKKTATDVFLKYPHKPVSGHLEDISGAIESIGKGGKIETTFHDSVMLTDACKLPELIKRIEKMIPKDSVIPEIARGFGDVLLNVLSVIELLHGEFTIAEQCGEETLKREFPITKLSPGDTLQALRRGFLTEEEATEELLVHGINKSRMNVMRDLGKQLLPVDQLIDLWYRGIIDDKDRDQGMLDLAYTAKQISAIMQESVRLIPPETVLTLYRYGMLSHTDLEIVLKENRFSDAEISAAVDVMYRPATGNEALDGLENRLLIGELKISPLWTDSAINDTIELLRRDPASDGLPGHEDLAVFVRGAMTEGLQDGAIRDRLFSIQNTLDINTWINLYFRGARTLSELRAVLVRHRIPPSLHDDLIASRRALIPFRTIPAMVAAGIISEAYAKSQLQGHGYDLTQAEALLDYALKRTKSTKATTAKELHTVSVQTAKSFWEQGAITEQQYRDILAQHGFDAATIDLTVRVESLELHSKERKQNAQAIVDEAKVGLITYDQALTRLANEGYTPVEIAKYAKSLISTKRVQSKLPSEGTLHQMIAHSVITIEQYKQALSDLGYPQFWVEAFARLRGASLAGEPV